MTAGEIVANKQSRSFKTHGLVFAVVDRGVNHGLFERFHAKFIGKDVDRCERDFGPDLGLDRLAYTHWKKKKKWSNAPVLSSSSITSLLTPRKGSFKHLAKNGQWLVSSVL